MEHLGYIIENDLIQSALFDVIDKHKIEFCNTKLSGLKKTDNGYELNLDNQTNLSCQLLVGADGANSQVRTLSAIEVTERDYRQKAIIANIISEKPFQQQLGSVFYQIVSLLYCHYRKIKRQLFGHVKTI